MTVVGRIWSLIRVRLTSRSERLVAVGVKAAAHLLEAVEPRGVVDEDALAHGRIRHPCREQVS